MWSGGSYFYCDGRKVDCYWIFTNFRGSLFPVMMLIFSFGMLKCLDRNFMSSALAFPFSGGAAIRIFNVPSSMVVKSSLLGALGITLILKY